LVKWSQKQEVIDAWPAIVVLKGIEKDALEEATGDFLDFILGDKIISS